MARIFDDSIVTAILIDGGFYRKKANKYLGFKEAKERADELDNYVKKHLYENINGKTYHHGWNTIRVDGIDYTFDSQADFRVRQRDEKGETKYVNFGTYYPNVFLVQYVNLAVNTFKNFRTY